MNKKIIFTAGGTGGHIFPAITLMKNFSEKGNHLTLISLWGYQFYMMIMI